jgi:23S rRNA (adenine2030-N6)-methyltransferase
LNYRHAFHAGNFADVWKHLALVLCLDHFRLKEAGFRALDVFAGVGLYDLNSAEAARSPEWRDGIARVRAAAQDGEAPAPVRRFLEALDAAGDGPSTYPGSPALIAQALRPQDRAVFCELHPADALRLGERFDGAKRIKVEARDGWTAVRALLPPPERRGLVLIDPPFEQDGEFERLAKAARDALERFATGTLILWHADKTASATARYRKSLSDSGARILTADFKVDEPAPGRGLVSAGLSVVNPPHTLEADLRLAGDFLVPVLARGPGAAAEVSRLSGRW